jgi:hypothetical protein
VPDLTGGVTVAVKNGGNHPDLVGVYLAFVPPAGSLNPGGCIPNRVSVIGNVNLPPRSTLTIASDPIWSCGNPSAVDGLSWTVTAIADAHADDVASCATVQLVLDGVCAAALADDDQDGADNTRVRSRPRVMAAR